MSTNEESRPYCEDCDRQVADHHWEYLCHCDNPEVGRTLAKGTPGEKKYCANCGKVIKSAYMSTGTDGIEVS